MISPSDLHFVSEYQDHSEEANKTYGFTIAVKELNETVPNIFRYASAYKRKNNIKSQGLWEMFVEKEPEKKTTPR